MRALNDERLNALREKMLKITYENKFNNYMGITVLELNENYCKTRIKYGDNVVNPYGTFHGGILSAFADTTAGTAACMCGYFVTTITCNLNYLLPAANTEYIYCEAMKLKSGKHIAFFDIRITDDKGAVLDSGEYTFFIGKNKVLE
ncbi:MAG: PaaI family thioesterase [Lachnospiraceae bacterium]|nr:PaaI family thioesterase [Lachnospiraceae bacterium]MBO7600355.1 PaaI family thioesterase [Lachnospiraceae bacterium]